MSGDTYQAPAHGWTCFHCGETFTAAGAARDHFGADQLAQPGCQIKAGEERGLLMALRRAEAELQRYGEEATDLHRQISAMQVDHRQALIRAEEEGYAKGVVDGRKHPTDNLDLISAEWLREVGFKWHQLDRQLSKHWLLWLGSALEGSMACYEDLGIELAQTLARQGNPTWFCWIRGDLSHRYSRFLHIRHLTTQAEVIRLVEAMTGLPWNPANHLFGGVRTPKEAARIKADRERLDRRLLMESTKWRDIEKDDAMGGALPEHLEAHEKAKPR